MHFVVEREIVKGSYFGYDKKSRLMKEGITKKLENMFFIGGRNRNINYCINMWICFI